MKKSFMKLFILLAVFSLFITACNNSKNTQDSADKQTSQTDKIETADNSSINSNKKTLAPEVNKYISEFTSKYLDMYNQEGNAFVKINLGSLDFLPKEVQDNAKFFFVADEDDSFHYYYLIVNLDDNVLYRVSALDNETYNERNIGTTYLSKGDCFVIIGNNSVDESINIKAYNMNDNTYADDYVYCDYGYVIAHSVLIWEKMGNKVAYKNDMYMLTYNDIDAVNESIDLDGDGVSEKIYFYRTSDNEQLEDSYYNYVRSLYINEKEYDLIELIGLTSEEELIYSKNIADIEIIDIDTKDDYKEIVLKTRADESGYEIAKLFHYKNGELENIGKVAYEGPLGLANQIEDSKLVLKAEGYEMLFRYYYDEVYSLNNGKLEKESKADVIKIHNSDRREIVTLMADKLNLYENKDSEEPMNVLEKGDMLLLLETDEKTWIKVKSFNTGKTGYIIFEKYDEGNYYSMKFKGQEGLSDFIELFEWS